MPMHMSIISHARVDARSWRHWSAVAAAPLWLLVSATPAIACPRCAEGQEARREVYADGFFRNLATALLPFLIVGGVSIGMHTVGRNSGALTNAERDVS